jgi:hypothetical protein
MDLLPYEVQNKILFPLYYKSNEKSLYKRIHIAHSFHKLQMIHEQITSLYKEYEYRRTVYHYSILKSITFPKYILIKNLSKYKCKSKKKSMKLYNTIAQFYLNSINNINNLNNTNISYNYYYNFTNFIN